MSQSEGEEEEEGTSSSSESEEEESESEEELSPFDKVKRRIEVSHCLSVCLSREHCMKCAVCGIETS